MDLTNQTIEKIFFSQMKNLSKSIPKRDTTEE